MGWRVGAGVGPAGVVPRLLLAVWAGGSLLLLGAVLLACDGQLMFSLDDPYIHLAVAENIVRGGYGLNAEEYSAPSSSIAWPLLLSLTELAGLGSAGALLLNLLPMGLAVYLVGVLLRDEVAARAPSLTTGMLLALGLASCFVMNAWGLPLTGMEHSLHVLLGVVVLKGLLAVGRGERTPVALVLAAAALPLVRFEGLALAGGSLLILVAWRRWRAAAAVAALAGAGLAAWFAFTQAVGLPPLPSSVLVKSDFASGALQGQGSALWAAFAAGMESGFRHRQATLLQLGLLGLAAWLAVPSADEPRRRYRPLAVAALLTGAAHGVAGQYGWFSRYEVYAVAAVWIAGLVLSSGGLARRDAWLFTVAAGLLVGVPYAGNTLRTPMAANNMYVQQYQMHRFVTEYWRKPVGANDVGWLSYRNPAYVLDLWGLGSEEVRRLRRQGTWGPEQMRALAGRHGVQLVLVYEDWFAGGLPAEWKKVASLRTPKVSSGSAVVSFFAADAQAVAQLPALLTEFRRTLPSGAELTLTD